MKTAVDARSLAETMIAIGRRVGLRTEAVLTAMDAPLGRAVGNALEIRECIETLEGRGPEDLEALCLVLAARMLHLGGAAPSPDAAGDLARAALASGRALERFRKVVERQGGDPRVVEDTHRLPASPVVETVVAGRAGFIREMRADDVGAASVLLGAGRDRVDAAVDPAAGILLRARVGDRVAAGEPIAELHVGAGGRVAEARARLTQGVVIGDDAPAGQPLVLDVIR
jgi:thymidine phosphorylase